MNAGHSVHLPISVNCTGPGDYDEITSFGNFTYDAWKINHPNFSIGRQNKFKLLCFDRNQGKRLLSSISPPSTKYNPDPLITR